MDKRYRKTVIAGNWKMNKKASEVKSFIDDLKPVITVPKGVDVALCVPFPLIPAMLRATKNCRVSVGAQDVSEHEVGAYTGEVSAEMLSDLGVKYTIVGHSERRAYIGETDGQVNRKLQAALALNITPIVCVGETLEQREMGLTMEHVSYQVKAALFGVSEDVLRKVIIAYEPIWAIGTGRTATAQQAEEVCKQIRAVLRELYGARKARGVSILYGGSMNAKNAAELLAQPDIDGGLIGGASLKPVDFAAIVGAAGEDE